MLPHHCRYRYRYHRRHRRSVRPTTALELLREFSPLRPAPRRRRRRRPQKMHRHQHRPLTPCHHGAQAMMHHPHNRFPSCRLRRPGGGTGLSLFLACLTAGGGVCASRKMLLGTRGASLCRRTVSIHEQLQHRHLRRCGSPWRGFLLASPRCQLGDPWHLVCRLPSAVCCVP